MAVRLDGDWEGWIRFLHGVAQTAQEATETAEKLELRESHRSLVLDKNLGQNGLMLL